MYAQGSALFAVKNDGSDAKQIVSVPGSEATWPRYSPDGSQLRFTVYTHSNGTSIWEVAADGGNLHQLLPAWTTPASACCGEWTADGNTSSSNRRVEKLPTCGLSAKPIPSSKEALRNHCSSRLARRRHIVLSQVTTERRFSLSQRRCAVNWSITAINPGNLRHI